LALSAAVAAVAAAQPTVPSIVPRFADQVATKTAVPFPLTPAAGASGDDNAIT
jgi:hypothetical protein